MTSAGRVGSRPSDPAAAVARYDFDALARNSLSFKRSRRIRGLVLHSILICTLLVMLYPIIWMVMSSLRPEDEIFGGLGLIPHHWTFENYRRGWELTGNPTFSLFFLNSFVICAVAIIGNLLSCSMAGYAFSRLDFRLKRFWFALMLGTIMLPIHAQLIPQYILFLKIGWVNTILPLVVPKFLATDSFYIFLMVQFMRSIPAELEQAAVMDGASYWQRYWRIVLPLSLPALVTTAVFTFIHTYNDFLSPLIYLTNVKNLTVPLALAQFMDPSGGNSSFGGLFAMVVASIGPVLGFYLASQRLLTRGIAVQGFK